MEYAAYYVVVFMCHTQRVFLRYILNNAATDLSAVMQCIDIMCGVLLSIMVN